ncbi:MAG: autotransporter-associated beta strand repeat-containing protein, partial [Patescibacteria group bacterium]|nr:autotransporter-associated beta strand repeat-containing protein [Patescibacteria group bacterium]
QGDSYGYANYVGVDAGTGTLNVEAGTLAVVGDGWLRIGSNAAGATGTVNLSGSGAITVARTVLIGSGNAANSGVVTISGNSQFTADTVIIADNTGNGTLNLNGGVLELSTLSIGSGAGAFNMGGGMLRAAATLNTSVPIQLTGGDSSVNSNGHAVTLGGVLSGNGGLTKLGAGTLTLAAANTYTGNTTVNAGLVTVTGSITGGVAGSRFVIGGSSGTNGAMLFDMGAASIATFYADGYTNSCDIGQGGGTGTLTLNSGTLNVATRTDGTRGSIRLGVNGTASGTLTVNGGALNVPGRILMAANSSTAAGTLTVNGGEVNLGTAGSGAYGDPGWGLLWTGAGTSTVHLNGGTLALYGFHGGSGTVNVNLDGGILRAQNNNTTFVTTSGTFNMIVKAGGAIIDTAGYNITLGRALAHDAALGATPDGGLVKTGAGALTLTTASTYTGATTVHGGALLVNGLLLANSDLTVHDTASLGGTGTVGGDVSIRTGGILAPGVSVGTLTVLGNLTFDAGALFDIDILGPGSADLLAMSGGLLTPGGATIRVNLGFQPELGDSWTILTGESDRTGLFSEEVALLSGAAYLGGWKRFDISYGSSVILTVVPEPTAGLLLCMTACGLLLRGRRRPISSGDGANR